MNWENIKRIKEMAELPVQPDFSHTELAEHPHLIALFPRSVSLGHLQRPYNLMEAVVLNPSRTAIRLEEFQSLQPMVAVWTSPPAGVVELHPASSMRLELLIRAAGLQPAEHSSTLSVLCRGSQGPYSVQTNIRFEVQAKDSFAPDVFPRRILVVNPSVQRFQIELCNFSDKAGSVRILARVGHSIDVDKTVQLGLRSSLIQSFPLSETGRIPGREVAIEVTNLETGAFMVVPVVQMP